MTININLARSEDIPLALEVELAAWPETDGEMQATEEKFRTRQSIGGLLIATHEGDQPRYKPGEPIGIISFQRPSWTDAEIVQQILKTTADWEWGRIVEKYGFPPTWYDATNDGYLIRPGSSTHNSDSNVGFLIGVAIHPKGRGHQLVDRLIQAALEKMISNNLVYAIGYTRLPAYEEHTRSNGSTPIDEYIKMKKPGTNLPLDYGLRFHVRNGAEIICPIPNAMYDDYESLGWGTLAIYRL